MTNDLTNKEALISYLKSHGLWAKHGLGQNFLVDREALDKIIDAADLKKSDFVIEVGPGLGVLTQELIGNAGKVIAVELDNRLAELLEENIPDPRLQIINADILKSNIPQIIDSRPYKVVANIPYYITSKIIGLFLTQEKKPESIVLLVQKEVAERITAKPGSMSMLALSVQDYGQPEIVGIVPKESFFPSPEVDSAILRIGDIRSRLQGIDEKEFFRLIHIGFASKRKTLANNLSAGLHIDKQQASGIIKSIGLNENVRAQELGLEDWKALARGIMNQEL